MEKPNWRTNVPGLAKAGLFVLALASVLALTLSVVRAQTANFDSSYKAGPASAYENDRVTYTIVAINTGDPVQGVVLSDTLPIYTNYVPDSCSYRRPGGAPQPCGPLVPTVRTQLWQEDFASGDRITTTFSVDVPIGTMNWLMINCAYLGWDGQQREMCVTTVVNPSPPINLVFLPIIRRNYPPFMPDLRVTGLTLEPANPSVGQPVTVTVQVQNVGGMAAGPFWVDLYDNPSPPPTQANQTWNMLCPGALEDCYGMAWYVDGGLNPGQSVTLSSLSGYEQEQTHWLGYFVQDGTHDLYAFADSWNWSVWYGAVEERNEGLDNRRGPLSINVAPGPLNGMIEQDQDVTIPWRPNQP